ncbi:hypothetical protein BGW80DRAFT_1249247 [Lactifluus volemus]|nr:hypothetical protein BGW80DRAFT_1249247 [Lactifluus volemus]
MNFWASRYLREVNKVLLRWAERGTSKDDFGPDLLIGNTSPVAPTGKRMQTCVRGNVSTGSADQIRHALTLPRTKKQVNVAPRGIDRTLIEGSFATITSPRAPTTTTPSKIFTWVRRREKRWLHLRMGAVDVSSRGAGSVDRRHWRRTKLPYRSLRMDLLTDITNVARGEEGKEEGGKGGIWTTILVVNDHKTQLLGHTRNSSKRRPGLDRGSLLLSNSTLTSSSPFVGQRGFGSGLRGEEEGMTRARASAAIPGGYTQAEIREERPKMSRRWYSQGGFAFGEGHQRWKIHEVTLEFNNRRSSWLKP